MRESNENQLAPVLTGAFHFRFGKQFLSENLYGTGILCSLWPRGRDVSLLSLLLPKRLALRTAQLMLSTSFYTLPSQGGTQRLDNVINSLL